MLDFFFNTELTMPLINRLSSSYGSINEYNHIVQVQKVCEKIG